jgi:uncharacterized membrane protein YfcA
MAGRPLTALGSALMNPKTLLFLALGAVTVWFLVAWRSRARAARAAARLADDPPATGFHAVVGFVMCFFDTLGIGNFATTTSMFKFKRSVRDEWIPGTLNVAYTLPTVAQALIYISIVRVDFLTLVAMIAAAVAGAWLGAGVVARWPRVNIQVGMGCALLAAAALMLLTQLQLVPVGGLALALRGAGLVAGLVGNFALGALMTLGIGLYAPCLILVSLLGMDPRAAFPIMMGSCAFLMPIAGMRFIREGSYSLRASVVLALAGIPAVLIAAYIVKEMPLTYVRWLVVVVVVYAAGTLLRSAFTEGRATPISAPIR